MNYNEYLRDNYQSTRKAGELKLENGLYSFNVDDRKKGKFTISRVEADYIVLEDTSSFSTISRLVIPLNRFAILHNVDKDLLK